MKTDVERFADWAEFLGVDGRAAFDIAAEHLDHFGVEGCTIADYGMEYLNQGDTYDLTLVLDDNDGLLVTSWGDWYEGAEQTHCENENVIRCGYCGEFTDCEEQWDETECSSCGNNVAG